MTRLTSESEFYSVEALATAMRMFNDMLLRVCGEREVECLDAATLLPRDRTIFFDDSHYTEECSRQLAGLVAEFLLQREPLTALRSD